MKNKEWLKNEVNELPLRHLGFSTLKLREEFALNKDDVMYLIDQLDEPKKPIIPQFVADYIEYYKARARELSLGIWLTFDSDEHEFEIKTEEWLNGYDSQEEQLKREYLLIDAIRYGYEVGVEKRYYVKMQSRYLCVSKHNKDIINIKQWKYINSAEKFEFTEEEINAMDKRYWAFAKDVTE